MYNVFTRTWWRKNPDWPNGLEPCIGPKTYIAKKLRQKKKHSSYAVTTMNTTKRVAIPAKQNTKGYNNG